MSIISFPNEIPVPKSFSQAFYNMCEGVPYEKMRTLFYELIFGATYVRNNEDGNKLLYSILSGQGEERHTFLTNLFVQRGKNFHYRNSRIVTFILDYLYQNDGDNFFLFLQRIDWMWINSSNSFDIAVPQTNLDNFSKNHETIINWFEQNNGDSVEQYFEYIYDLTSEKPSYAYGLIVLWTILNENVVYLIDLIKRIIIYDERPTTEFSKYKKYIIKSAMNKPLKSDDVFLSVRRVSEPLSESEETATERDILFSVTSAKFHSSNSIFSIEKCSESNRYSAETDNDTEDLINEHKAAELLRSFQSLFKPTVPDLTKSLTPSKSEPYYIKVGSKFLTYNSWFAQTRVILKSRPESRSRWRLAISPDNVSIFNCGQPINIFALDIPNGMQTIPTVMWCFPSLSQAAQRFTIHEVIDWQS